MLVTPGALSAGMEYPSAKFALITHGHISSLPTKKRRRPKNCLLYTSELDNPFGYGRIVRDSVSAGIYFFDGLYPVVSVLLFYDSLKHTAF